MCEKYGIFFLLDATQTVGQIVVNVQKLKCDALCTTGRKFLRGPRGTGILYVRNSAMKSLGEPVVVDHFGALWVSYVISGVKKGIRYLFRDVWS